MFGTGITRLWLIGLTEDKPGNITAKNVTAVNDAGTITNIILSNYDSAGGDSGAPVITLNGSDSILHGTHVGRWCSVTFENQTQVGAEFVINDVCWTRGLADTYTGFTPWENIVSGLGWK